MSCYIYNLWGDICDNDIEKDKLFEYIYNFSENSYSRYMNKSFEKLLYCNEDFDKINKDYINSINTIEYISDKIIDNKINNKIIDNKTNNKIPIISSLSKNKNNLNKCPYCNKKLKNIKEHISKNRCKKFKI